MVEKFLQKIRQENPEFKTAPIYLYGTEGIGDYYRLFDLNGKSVLAVNGSGDQVLDAYYFGAKRVVGFDIVRNTKYVLELKAAAIRNLSLLEFLAFFGDEKDMGNFNHKTYERLREEISAESRDFFDRLYGEFNNDGHALLRSDKFRSRKEFYSKIRRINPFLADEKSYDRMRQAISGKNLEFAESDIRDVSNRVPGKFDLINLSNVLNYISKDLLRDDVQNPLEYIYQKILLPLRSILTPDGKIIFYCFYRRPDETETMPLVNQGTSIEWLSQQPEFKLSRRDFEGILFGRDSITVLEKV
ncbi:MAG: DUF3419 family protein [Nanoarchaeota archaeon]|nr:DUF3419 family protein [Nanoarchaeota archaeon]